MIIAVLWIVTIINEGKSICEYYLDRDKAYKEYNALKALNNDAKITIKEGQLWI